MIVPQGGERDAPQNRYSGSPDGGPGKAVSGKGWGWMDSKGLTRSSGALCCLPVPTAHRRPDRTEPLSLFPSESPQNFALSQDSQTCGMLGPAAPPTHSLSTALLEKEGPPA